MKKASLLLVALICIIFLKAQNVGIGTTTPNGPLTVIANDTARGITQKKGNVEIGFWTNTSGAYVQTWTPHNLNFATNNGLEKITLQNSDGFVGINTNSPTAQMDINGTLRIRGNGAAAGKVLTSDASGNATWQSVGGTSGTGIGFRGELTSNLAVTQATGEIPVTGFTEEFDDGGGFNGSTGAFTVPSAGVYQFTINLNWIQSSSNTGSSLILGRLYLNRSGANNVIEQITTDIPNNTSYTQSQNFSSIIKLNVGDIITFRVDPLVSSTFTLSGNGSPAARFSGAKLY